MGKVKLKPLKIEERKGKKERMVIRDYLIEQYGCFCYYCGDQFPRHKLTIDHIFPRIKGGRLTIGNTVLCCYPCNLRKGQRIISIEEFRREVQGDRYVPVSKVILPKKPKVHKVSTKPITGHIRGPESLTIVHVAEPLRRPKKRSKFDFIFKLFRKVFPRW